MPEPRFGRDYSSFRPGVLTAVLNCVLYTLHTNATSQWNVPELAAASRPECCDCHPWLIQRSLPVESIDSRIAREFFQVYFEDNNICPVVSIFSNN